MTITQLGLFPGENKINFLRPDKIEKQRVTVTAGAPVKADDIILSDRAKKHLSTNASPKALTPELDTPVCYGPKDRPTLSGTSAGALQPDRDPPICFGPKDHPVTGTTKVDLDGKIDDVIKVATGDVKKIDGEAVEDIIPPRTRAEIWRDGWRQMVGVTRRINDVVNRAADPNLTSAERAQLNTEFKALVAEANRIGESAANEAGLTGGQAQVWRNSLGQRELFITGADDILTAKGAAELAERIKPRVDVVERTAQYFRVA